MLLFLLFLLLVLLPLLKPFICVNNILLNNDISILLLMIDYISLFFLLDIYNIIEFIISMIYHISAFY